MGDLQIALQAKDSLDSFKCKDMFVWRILIITFQH